MTSILPLRRLILVGMLFGFAVARISARAAILNLQPNPLFTPNMVLQFGARDSVYGKAGAGDTITVEFAGQRKTAPADADGHWKINLDPMPASFQGRNLMVSSRETGAKLVLTNVLVGDVWLASGQSNMERPVADFNQLLPLLKNARHPQIRLVRIETRADAEPQSEVKIHGAFAKSWQECGGNALLNVGPAVYYFASRLQADLNVPVGVILSAVGGTRIEPWMPPAAWAASSRLPITGQFPPATLFNGMIHPLVRFRIKGVIWYQGESSALWSDRYARQFSTLIQAWRDEWNEGDFPFLYVQLAPFRPVDGDQTGESWAWLREAQLKTLSVPKTGMVVTTDVGEYNDIHPQRKQPVGDRLALLAERMVGKKVHALSPVFARMKIKGGSATIYFRNADSGLVAQRVVMNRNRGLPWGDDPNAYVVPDGKLCGFVICGSDRRFVPAEAKIHGDTVVVSSPQVKQPVAVRYGWADFPLCNLFNGDGLPASPFRTDAFPMPDFLGRKIGTVLDGDASALGTAATLLTNTPESALEIVKEAGRTSYKTSKLPAYTGRYVYAQVNSSEFADGANPFVRLKVLYFDNGPETIEVLYDSSDKSVSVVPSHPGAWKLAGRIRINYTKTWRVASFDVSDALFAHRLNGADVRLQWPMNVDAALGGIYLHSLKR